MKKVLSGLIVLLLLAMTIGVTATPWDGVADDPTPAQAIWIDPKNITSPPVGVGDVFTVDVLINITDPPGAATGMYGFQYKLKWDPTRLEVVEIQTHTDKVPSTDILTGWTDIYIAANATGSGPPKAPEGFDYHSYSVSATGGVAFTGVASLCTYKFQVVVNASCRLDIYDDILVDDTATEMPHTTVDGYYITGNPIAAFTYSPEYPSANQTVTFDATESRDPDGTIESYTWDFDDGTSPVVETDPIVTHNFTDYGAYNVTLRVTDDEGLNDTAWRIVKVGTVADFTYSPEFPIPGETVTFDARPPYRSRPASGRTIANYTWDFGDGTSIVIETVGLITHNYTASGKYNVTLTVTDSGGLTDSTTKRITVCSKPVANFTWSPTTPKVGETVTFNASASYDPDGDIAEYSWDFDGDGKFDWATINPITNKTYAPTMYIAGTYDVTLMVTDAVGLTDTITKPLTIAKLSSSISIFVSPTTLKVGEDTTISGDITPDKDRANVTIHYRLSGETTWNTTTVTANATGGYSYTWTPEEAGTYEFKASWQGDANTLGDESSAITVTVEEEAPSYLLYVIIVIVFVIVAAVVIYFLKIKKS